MALLNVVVQSDAWNLPKGRLLETILSSCQVERISSGAIETEHMLCPTRLASYEFPQVLKDAVLAGEDERFQAHGAIDPRSGLRALWQSFAGNRQGGSTITQQLARSMLLKKEDSFARKLREAILAERIFARLSREEILARYLNVVPHARNLNGFDDPARYYFGVRAQELNLAEAALLVGMLPEPNNRDPLRHPAEALRGGTSVLQGMAEQGMVTEAQAATAEAELKRRVLDGGLRRGDEVYRRIEYRPYRDLALREARANGAKLSGDYRLIAHIDAEFQRTLLTQICAMTGRHEAAGVFMRPSGEVLALAGSCNYTGAWNRAADIARSIGSTGKLFPLIGVHEAGLSLATRVSTRPLRRWGWPAEPNSRCMARRFVSLDYALDQSCNRPWTDAAMRLGPRLTEIVSRFDISPPGSPSLVPIGGVQTSPLKLTQAYAALRNGGRLPNVSFLVAAIGPRGEVLALPARKDARRVMAPWTASAILQDLRGPVKQGTARAANSVHALVYGKTGTSSRNEDALFVGLTEDFAGSFWLGHDQPRPMPGINGGGAPAKAFAKLTDFYYVKRAQTRFAEARRAETGNHPLARWRRLDPERRWAFMAGAFLALLATYVSLSAMRRRRERPQRSYVLTQDRNLPSRQAPLQSS
jgi:penicillin-binding protein 1A